MAERVWGVSLRTELGKDHPLVGRSAPDFALADGSRLGARLRDGKGLLLDFDAQSSLRTLAGTHGVRVSYLSGDAADQLGLSTVLIRPDGIVAWAANASSNPEDAAKAMSQWFSLGEEQPSHPGSPGRETMEQAYDEV